MNKALLGAVALTLTTSILGMGESQTPKPLGDWNLVKHIFVTEPREKVDTLSQTSDRLILSAVAYFMTNFLTSFSKNRYLSFVPYLAATATFVSLRKAALREAEKRQLERVMKAWPQLKASTPGELHETFENLASQKNEAESQESLCLERVVKLWPQLKASIPSELHETFENRIALQKNEAESQEYFNLLSKPSQDYAVQRSKEGVAKHFQENKWLTRLSNLVN